MWENLSDKLISILEANTLIQESYDYEVGKFEGDPAVTLTPSSNESDYSTTIHNERVYAFNCMVFVDRTKRGDSEAERVCRALVDSILDDFDKNYTLSGLLLSAGYTMLYVEAVPARWGYVERENVYRVAEITIKVHLDVDVTTIT
ncbi:MAG: hypothetical protein UV20_C0009G0019 [Candidatus Magasanikbacteria bacterium GW2011_GWA2_42_32]|uniref:Phage protein n=1 Tax=Candidatus Magasanikbacteria bacterium GW2011_GWA2_42_32 TaxID=1619039 RepID=A0A0G1A691_9BACT|nr:MAG: hypothetical protein UV20_C0009G0019 [Candidatus Magasanikbacteria bacterium GW2011_GWA2_42_32]HBX15906.1 hypothetical protein [Candidatus Magasanikbacteria bacterium]